MNKILDKICFKLFRIITKDMPGCRYLGYRRFIKGIITGPFIYLKVRNSEMNKYKNINI